MDKPNGSRNFNPRSPRGERQANPSVDGVGLQFQSTLPARGATTVGQYTGLTDKFQSTLPARGATPPPSPRSRPKTNFNPRSPRGERLLASKYVYLLPNISIHAPREGSDRRNSKSRWMMRISIHAPREGSDSRRRVCLRLPWQISIHAPREGSDSAARVSPSTEVRFQSTLPARGATGRRSPANLQKLFQSTLPARGATEVSISGFGGAYEYFNPRSPRGERQIVDAALL